MTNHKDPDSDVNVPRTIKKTAVSWLVTGLLAVLCLGILALGRAQVSDMLRGYVTRDDMQSIRSSTDSRINDYARQLQEVQDTLRTMDKKLDHLQFVIDYNQGREKVLSPKQKDNP